MGALQRLLLRRDIGVRCFMDPYADATDRTAADYILVAIGCLAVLFFLTGVVVESPGLTFASGCVILLSVISFAVRRRPEGEG